MAIKIVTDSTADIPKAMLQGLDITIVPLNIHFGDKTFRDGVDLSSDDFFKLLVQSPSLPTTSQPSVGLFQEAYERLSSGGNGIVSIHLSKKLSGTFDAAQLARMSSSANCTIEVIDSQLASMGLGQVVLAAAKMAKAGANVSSIKEMVEYRSSRTHIIFFVDTLEYLQKGGRIGKASAFLGTLLNVKPVLKLVEGEVHPSERVRTRSKAIDRLVDIAKGFPHIEELAILHSACPEDAGILAERLSKNLPPEKVMIGSVGPVIGTHVGPGILGFSLFEG